IGCVEAGPVQHGSLNDGRFLPPKEPAMCMDPDENLHLSHAFPGSKKPRHGAFTLIELMVVISIITLLLAILLPVLRHARVSSQRVVSVSIVRQISMSMHMYANDFKSSMPFLKQKALNPDGTVNTSGRWRPQWSKLLVDRGYLNGAQVY